MTFTTTKTVVTIIVVLWLFTVGRSLLIMICGGQIFKKARKGEKTAFYPILNLFTMLEVTEISTFFGILLFIPLLNMIVLTMMSIKLGKVFNCKGGFLAGLVFLPIMFYPLIAFSDKQYKVNDEAFFKAMDNARGESINLMTEEEIQEQNNEIVPEKEVDSIFKSDIEIKATKNSGPYRATKIDLLGLEKLKEASQEDELLKPIKRIDEVKESSSNNQNTVAPNEKKDNNDIEMLDL